MEKVKKDSEILSYMFLYVDSESGVSYFPFFDKKYWQISDKPISPYQKLLYKWTDRLILFFILGGILSLFFLKQLSEYSSVVVFLLILPIFLMLIIREIHNRIYTKKIETIHKKFKNGVFYITQNGVGCSEEYGIRDYFLPSQNISSLEFIFSSSIYHTNKCIITYSNKKRTKVKLARNEAEKENISTILESLNELSKTIDCPIKIYLKDKEDRPKVKEIVSTKNIAVQISK